MADETRDFAEAGLIPDRTITTPGPDGEDISESGMAIVGTSDIGGSQYADDIPSYDIDVFELGELRGEHQINVLPDWVRIGIEGVFSNMLAESSIAAVHIVEEVERTSHTGVFSGSPSYTRVADLAIQQDSTLTSLYADSTFLEEATFRSLTYDFQGPRDGPEEQTLLGLFHDHFTGRYYLEIETYNQPTFVLGALGSYDFTNRYVVGVDLSTGLRADLLGADWVNFAALTIPPPPPPPEPTPDTVLADAAVLGQAGGVFFDDVGILSQALVSNAGLANQLENNARLAALAPGEASLLGTILETSTDKTLMGQWSTRQVITETLRENAGALNQAASVMSNSIQAVNAAFTAYSDYKVTGDLPHAIGSGSVALLIGLVSGEVGTIVGGGVATVLATTVLAGTGLPIIAGVAVAYGVTSVIDWALHTDAHLLGLPGSENERVLALAVSANAPSIPVGENQPAPSWSYDIATDTFTWLDASRQPAFDAAATALHLTLTPVGLELNGDSLPGIVNDYLVGADGGDTINGLTGNDIITGEKGADTLSGGAGLDALYGGEDQDILQGGAGNDLLDGGTGADNLIGGVGDDTYYVDDVADHVSEIINQGDDIVFSSVSFNLTGQYIEGLTLTGAGNLNATGNSLDNYLVGNAGANVLTGGYGNDTLDGGAGIDQLAGNVGDDTYYVDNVADHVSEIDGQGNDTVFSSVSFSLAGQYIEGLTLTGAGNLNATGNSLDNRLVGNAGANGLTGGYGNDVLDGGAGIDQLAGGVGDDTYYVDNVADHVSEILNQGNDIVFSSVSFSLAGQYIEGLTLTGSGNINATGNTLDNRLVGNAGANGLTGGSGNDVLDGGAGVDQLAGGTGNDIYYVDNVADHVTEIIGQGDDLIFASVSFSLAGQYIEGLTLTGTGNLDATGNSLDNRLVGNAGANGLTGGSGNDVLDGGAGVDQLSGGIGDDTYYVDNVADHVSEINGQGNDTVFSSVSFSLAGQYIEGLTLTGSGNLNATGNSLDNYLVGNAGANGLTGGYGNDTLDGGAGNDRLIGDVGIDQLLGGLGSDSLYGGADADSLFGEDGADALYGGAGIDYLVGGIGNDTLDGGAEADAIYGEAGDDTLWGGAGFVTDILVGGDGNDTLRADSGMNDYDLIDGGAGNDAYYVDTGDDLTFEGAGGGTDTVYADVAGANNGVYLYAEVENLVLLNTTAFGVGNELANTLTGSASGNWLLGGVGNDSLNGKAGGDVLFGEAGNDTFVFEHGTGGDVIGDFAHGSDKMNLADFHFASFAALQNSFHQSGSDGAIDLGGGDFVVLLGVTMATLDAGDFVL
jgi:Ca2+-binding RTX toxin-like protein